MPIEALPYFTLFAAMWIAVLYSMYYFAMVRGRKTELKKQKIKRMRGYLGKLASSFRMGYSGGWLRPLRLAGLYEGYAIDVVNESIGEAASIRFTCSIDSPRWNRFSLTLENTVRGAAKSLITGDGETGDRDFDAAFVVGMADNDSATAFLDSITRRRILKLSRVASSLAVSPGKIVMVAPAGVISSSTERAKLMGTLKYLAEKLSKPSDMQVTLLGAIRKEKIPAVKARQLRVLAARFPGDNKTGDVMRRALRDDDPAVRVEAAKFLGATAMKSLAELVKSKKEIPAELLADIVQLCAEHNFRPAVPLLADLYRRHDHSRGTDLRPGILEALFVLGDSSISDFLVDRLRDPDSSIQKGAVRALSACGRVSAVEPLMRMERETLNPFFKQEIRAAVASIQIRLESGDRGWLSDAGTSPMEGALSGVAASEGALSGEAVLSEEKEQKETN